MKKGKIVCAVFAVALMCMWMQETTPAAEPYEGIANSDEWAVLKIVNKERLEQGLEAVSIFEEIQDASGVRAKEIADLFSHTRPNETSCFTALKEAGVNYSCAGENIAAGYQSAEDVMDGWMNSPGHKANILGAGYTHIGVGYDTGGMYGKNWVQMFVGSCTLQSIAVNDAGTPNYPVGTSVDQMNRYLIVKCSLHGTGYVPVIQEMCTGYNSKASGAQTITVNFRGRQVKMPVTTGSSDVVTVQKPAKVKKLKVKAKSKTAVKLTWSKTESDGYEVWMATSAKGTYKKVKTIKASEKTTYKVKKLKSAKKYYFKLRAYKKSQDGKIYGSFSKPIVVKTK